MPPKNIIAGPGKITRAMANRMLATPKKASPKKVLGSPKIAKRETPKKAARTPTGSPCSSNLRRRNRADWADAVSPVWLPLLGPAPAPRTNTGGATRVQPARVVKKGDVPGAFVGMCKR